MKMVILLVLSNMEAKVSCLSSQKLNHLVSSVCCCTVLLEHAKVKLQQTRKCDRFALFVAETVKFPEFVISKPD